MVLAEYDDYGMWHEDPNLEFEVPSHSREGSRLPDISETNSVLPRKSTLPDEYHGQKLKGIEDSPLKIKKSKRVFSQGPSLVTDYAGKFDTRIQPKIHNTINGFQDQKDRNGSQCINHHTKQFIEPS